MDYIEDDPTYAPKSYRSKRLPLYPNNYNYIHDDEVEDDDDEFDEQNDDEFDESYNPRYSSATHSFEQATSNDGFQRYPKRQKLKNPVSNFEFVPRKARSVGFGDGNSGDWSEHEKFVLLEMWGDKFLQLRRNSLRSEDWVEIAEKVSEATKINRTEGQCRLMMDGLKRKYKKEKEKGGGCSGYSKWGYFNKMDMLMKQESGSIGGFGLACGVDSGEYVFTDTRVYLDRANGNDEMRDSPCESEEEEDEERGGSGGNEEVKGLRVLAESVQKFGEIYGKIENSKREQMMELERMRVEFQKDLDLQKKQILERAQAEIAKIREESDDEEADEDFGDDVDNEDSGGNVDK